MATELALGREVVIKIVRPELLEGVSVDRFAREVQLASRLQQANIVPVLSAGDAAGTSYYIMPYVRGESLRARIATGQPVPVAEALNILRDVARALAYAHGEGVVHRDIKPDNILLSGRTAVVTDFGIAKALDATRTLSGTGTLTGLGLSVGTPAYMAPEQAAGDPHTDFRADLYAWGLVAWELLAGRHPFASRTTPQALITAQMSETPASLTSVRADVPETVASLVARCLAKDPHARPASAEAILGELESVGTPGVAKPASRLPMRGLAMVSVVSAGVFAVALWMMQRDRSASTDEGALERIAVLPMENKTGDTAQAFFADGMTREVIGVLTDAGVRVLGYRAVAAYRNSSKPLKEIAKELGVDAIVAGELQQAGAVITLSAELINARNDENLWSRKFEKPAADVVSLQRDVATEITRGIRARLTPDQQQRLAAARQVNPRAYAQYLLGQEAAALRTADGFKRSVEYIRRSLAIDSTYAPAWATLAITNAYALIYQTAPRDLAYNAAMHAANRAIALDDSQGDAYLARGIARLHNAWDFVGGYADFDTAESRPSSSLGLGLRGYAMWELHDSTRMIKGSRDLVDQEPTTAQWRADLAWDLWSNRDAAEALASAQKGIEVDSSFYEAFDIYSLILADAGDFAGAEAAHRQAVKVAGGDYWVRLFNAGLIASRRGDTAGVQRALTALDGDPRLAQRGGLLFLVGKKDSAYALLNTAIAKRDPDLLQILNAMPALYPFRHEPRYQALLAKMGMPERLRR
jgi:serine/threonine-protein kinase